MSVDESHQLFRLGDIRGHHAAAYYLALQDADGE